MSLKYLHLPHAVSFYVFLYCTCTITYFYLLPIFGRLNDQPAECIARREVCHRIVQHYSEEGGAQ